MASVIVTLGQVVTRNIFDGDAVRSETITSSGITANGALVAARGDVAKVTCATAVYARSGGPCTAATGAYCQAGIAEYIRMTEGDVVAVIDA